MAMVGAVLYEYSCTVILVEIVILIEMIKSS